MTKIKLTEKEIENLHKVYENISSKATNFELMQTDSSGICNGLILICKFEGFTAEIDITDYESW